MAIQLQVGMNVKIKEDKIGFPKDSGTIKTVTNIPDRLYLGLHKQFELDNRIGDIFLIEDFEYCVNYPNHKMR